MEFQKRLVFNKLNSLGTWLIDRNKLNMRDIIDNALNDKREFVDMNEHLQQPLSILYKTNKFPDIKYDGGVYYTSKLENCGLVRKDGKWHPVNKLNTNYTDVAVLLTDILFDDLSHIQNVDDIKKVLLNSREKIKDTLSGMGDQLFDYTTHIIKFSEIGEAAERSVERFLRAKGMETLYKGGDGDFIDMIYGSDLIMSMGDKIYLIQVKSSENATEAAFKGGRYAKIDWFCTPLKDGTLRIWSDKTPEGKIIKIIDNYHRRN